MSVAHINRIDASYQIRKTYYVSEIFFYGYRERDDERRIVIVQFAKIVLADEYIFYYCTNRRY